MKYGLKLNISLLTLIFFVNVANAQLTLSGPSSAYHGVVSGPYCVNIPSGDAVFLATWTVTNGTKYTPSATCTYVIWDNTSSGTIKFSSGSHGSSNTKTVSLSTAPPPPPPPSVPIANDESRCSPGSLTLTVSGGGDLVSGYRWYHDQSGGTSFHAGTSYTTVGMSVGQTTTYWVSAYGVSGESARDRVRAIINTPPTVDAGTYSSICANETILLTGTPSGGSWSGTGVSGTTFSYAVPGIYALSYSYTDGNGCENSHNTNITVREKSTTPVLAPDNEGTRCGVGTLKLSATFDGDLFFVSYQWYNSDRTPISGATSSRYTTPSLTTGSYLYYISISDAGKCESNLLPVSATVYDTPNPGTLTVDKNKYCLTSNDFPTLTISGQTGTPTNIRWQMADYGSDLNNESSWYSASGGQNDSLTPTAVQLIQSRYFRRLVTFLECGAEYTSNNVFIQVNNSVVAGTIQSPVTLPVCIDTDPGTITELSSATLGDGDYSFEWFYSYNDQDWIPTGTTTNDFAPGNISQSTYYKRIDNSCIHSDETNVIQIETFQWPAPSLKTQYITCEEENKVIEIVGYASETFEWIRNDVILANSSNQLNVSDIGLDAGVYEYSVTRVGDGGCRSLTTSFTVTVYENCDYNMNFIKTTNVQKAGITSESELGSFDKDNLSQKKVYFNGVGQPIQEVVRQGSPNLSTDIIKPIVYDPFMRVSQDYLPFVNNSKSGIYHADPTNITGNYEESEQYDFYQNTAKVAVDGRPNGETFFEPSPLNRVDRQYGPGEAWSSSGNDKPISYVYASNTANEVRLWSISSDYPMTVDYYPKDQLTKTSTTDEEGHQVIEFADKLNRTILKRVQVVADPSPTYNPMDWADTYYVYDDFGNLRFVLPPEGTKALTE